MDHSYLMTHDISEITAPLVQNPEEFEQFIALALAPVRFTVPPKKELSTGYTAITCPDLDVSADDPADGVGGHTAVHGAVDVLPVRRGGEG